MCLHLTTYFETKFHVYDIMKINFNNIITLKQIELDATDLRLLALLQNNSALTQRELAAQAEISPATAMRRIARMREQGVIERETAILNPEAIGSCLQVIAEITLDQQNSAALDAFETQAAKQNAVQQCYRVSAGPDFILVIAVADMAAYQSLAQTLFSVRHNVRNVRAFFATRRSKFSTALPLPQPTL